MPQTYVADWRCYFRLEGNPERPPLVLLHPIGADLSLWDKPVPLLMPHFHILRYDLRGHGGSEAPAGPYALSTLVADLLALMDQLGMARAHLCGISLGGMVAAATAAESSERVASLTLCSTPIRLAPPPGGWDGRAQAVLQGGMAPLADGMVQRMVSAAHLGTNDPAVHSLRAVFARTDPVGYAGACAILRDADLSTVLGQVPVRTRVITATEDALIPHEVGQRMVEQLPNGRHLVLDGGHFPPIEQPEAFASELIRWTASERD